MFDSFAVGVEYTFIILMCVYYIAVQLKGTSSLYVYSTSNFWIIITFIIYISGTFFLYIMTENIMHDKNIIHHKEFRFLYTIINSAFNILKNILLSMAMIMKPSPVTTYAPKKNDMDDLFSYKLKN